MINSSSMDMIANKLKRPVPATLAVLCIYLFLLTERPWESIRYLEGIPIERVFAAIMLLIALLAGTIKIAPSSTNKWVYSLLALHFIFIPFSFNYQFTIDQGYEYAKVVLVYMLMLAVAEDEFLLKILVKAFVFSMMFYMLHSLWEYHNGRHVWRMGIARMIGVDHTHSDPNAFGASVVLSLPFVYALLRNETKPRMRKLYVSYCALAVLCVVLTGSRSASIALVFLSILLGVAQKGWKKIWIMMVVVCSLAAVWVVMPEEKQERIRTLWDENAGPKGAHQSADGRVVGWKVSWEMFKQRPFTGVGPGGENYIGYRIKHNIDGIIGGLPSPTQAHILYGEVLAELGILGALFFAGLVVSIWQNSKRAQKILHGHSGAEADFLNSLATAIVTSLLLLLLFGLSGHNFYRELWLWLAAWSGSLVLVAEKVTRLPQASPWSIQMPVPVVARKGI